MLIYDNRLAEKNRNLLKVKIDSCITSTKTAKFVRPWITTQISEIFSYQTEFFFARTFFFFQTHTVIHKLHTKQKAGNCNRLMSNENALCSRYSTEKNWLVISIFRRKLDQTSEHFMAYMKFYARHHKNNGVRCVPISWEQSREIEPKEC